MFGIFYVTDLDREESFQFEAEPVHMKNKRLSGT
jgi:hypothetical protein